MKYYGRLFGEERGKRARYWDTGKTGKDWEDIEKERDHFRIVAGELCAAIRVNTMRGTFATATIEDIDSWLKQWTDKLGLIQGTCPMNAKLSDRHE